MADYSGFMFDTYESESRQANPVNSEASMRMCIGWMMDTTKKHGGAKSLRLMPGGRYEFFYGCVAGSTTITVWVYPPVASKCCLQIYNPETGTKEAEAWNVSAGAWEQLSLSFTSEKKVYLGRLANFTSHGADACAWFDDLV